MTFLVTCIPQAGHLNPMLPLVSALLRSGCDVVVASGEAVRNDVEAVGARFEPVGAGLDAWFGELAARTRGAPGDGLPPQRIPHYFVPRLFCEIAATDMVDGLLDVGERLRPDMLMFDGEAFAGPLAARLLGVRQVNHLFGPMLAPEVSQLATDAMSPLWRAFGLDVTADAGLYDGVTIAVCPPALDPALPPRGTRHLLRPAPPPVRALRPQSPPLVYFSLGTMWSSIEVVHTALAALGGLPVQVIATLGALDPAELRSVPANVALHQYVPQQQVLPDASLVIHHAGAGTMFGALAHGIPQIALPQAADNFMNADLLVRSGAALALAPSELTSGALADAVRQVLEDTTFADAARAVAQDIAQMPTADEVAATLRA